MKKFCPNCGQENSENRKPFHYLFTHFVEDLTHYDGQFWGTIKNLLFKPGKLTEVYLEGKRKRFVPPVKLYIFISFITFFLFAVLPPFNTDFSSKKPLSDTNLNFKKAALAESRKSIDSLKKSGQLSFEDSVAISKLSILADNSDLNSSIEDEMGLEEGIDEEFVFKGHKNRKSYDSAQAKNPLFWDFIDRPIAHKLFELKERGVKKGEILRNFVETSIRNLPKALFFYLPVFAFFLWVFHNKKKYWYYEHGVFTLHYFSFLLLVILLFSYMSKLVRVSDIIVVNRLLYMAMIAMLIYSILYFFIAHRRIYHSRGWRNFLMGFLLFVVNYVGFMFLVLLLAWVSFLMLH